MKMLKINCYNTYITEVWIKKANCDVYKVTIQYKINKKCEYKKDTE